MSERVYLRGVFAIAITLVAALSMSSSATATTAVSGAWDTNAPLVIDPSTSPTDPLTTTQLSQNVMFIQSMPSTKVINQVTIGDLAVASGCSTGTAYVQIGLHPGGDLQSSPTATYNAIDGVPITSTLGKLTWNFSPLKLKRGEGYSFRVAVYGCWAMQQRTWAHNSSQVNGGPDPCEDAPSDRRMWHVQGQSDAQEDCVTPPTGSRRFDPSMNGGWLVSVRPAQVWDIMGGSWFNWMGTGGNACSYGAAREPETLGANWTYWRPRPDLPDDVSEHNCLWSQFGPLGEELQDGWYYALPWLTERDGAPRDMYLELGTVDYSNLLADYVPVLLYDAEEEFHALSPGAATDFYDDSDDPNDPDDANRLVDSEGAFATANPGVATDQEIDILNLSYLAEDYTGTGPRGGSAAAPTDFVSLRGNASSVPFLDFEDYANDSSTMESTTGYAHRVYGRVVAGPDGAIWLQYWLYYYFDPQVNEFGHGVHEGDWELVQIRLNSSNQPDLAAYAQHGDGERCNWATQVDKYLGRPIVYVAEDSHASYFRAGHYEDPETDEDADGLGVSVPALQLQEIGQESPAWVAWPGKWGDSGESPDGPAFQTGQKWTHPSAWAGGLHPCDVE